MTKISTRTQPRRLPAAPARSRLTGFAFVLALGLAAARMTVSENLREAFGSTGPGPRFGGPGAGLGLDLLCWLPALLVLARRVVDRGYARRGSWSFAPLFLLAAWMACSTAWAADKFAAAVGASHFAAAAALLWATAQLVRDWARLRLTAAVGVGLLLVLGLQGLSYRLIDLPQLRQFWAEYYCPDHPQTSRAAAGECPECGKPLVQRRLETLRQRRLDPGSFLAEQFERNLTSGSMLGFYVSPNTYAAVTVLCMVVALGWACQRLSDRGPPGGAADESRSSGDNAPSRPAAGKGPAAEVTRRPAADASPRGTGPPAVTAAETSLALIVVGLLGGLYVLTYCDSRGANATLLLGVALLGCLRLFRGWLARRPAVVFAAALAGVGVVAGVVVVHGLRHGTLFHESLTFRWRYWVGSARVIAAHPLRGVGWGNFGSAYLPARLPVASEEVKDPHNFLVRFVAELGLVGGALAVAWLASLWWGMTRPAAAAPGGTGGTGGAPGGGEDAVNGGRQKPAGPTAAPPRAMAVLAGVAGVAFAAGSLCSIDWSQPDAVYLLTESLKRLLFLCAFLVGAALVTLRSFTGPEADDRPAPWALGGVLVALGMFLVHCLIDVAFFESGPLCLFALLAGGVLGVRLSQKEEAAAGAPAEARRPHGPAAALAVAALLWLIVGGALWAPTLIAEEKARSADEQLTAGGRSAAGNDPAARIRAYRLLLEAARAQPLNADYIFRAAQEAPAEEYKALFERAARADPMDVACYRAWAETVLARAPGRRGEVKELFARAAALDPCNVSLRLRFAQALRGFGDADSLSEMRRQYDAAVWYTQQLDPANQKRKDSEAYLAYADALAAVGDRDGARARYDAATAADSRLPEKDPRRLPAEKRAEIDAKRGALMK